MAVKNVIFQVKADTTQLNKALADAKVKVDALNKAFGEVGSKKGGEAAANYKTETDEVVKQAQRKRKAKQEANKQEIQDDSAAYDKYLAGVKKRMAAEEKATAAKSARRAKEQDEQRRVTALGQAAQDAELKRYDNYWKMVEKRQEKEAKADIARGIRRQKEQDRQRAITARDEAKKTRIVDDSGTLKGVTNELRAIRSQSAATGKAIATGASQGDSAWNTFRKTVRDARVILSALFVSSKLIDFGSYIINAARSEEHTSELQSH